MNRTDLFETLCHSKEWGVVKLMRWIHRDLGSYDYHNNTLGFKYCASYTPLAANGAHKLLGSMDIWLNVIPDGEIWRLTRC